MDREQICLAPPKRPTLPLGVAKQGAPTIWPRCKRGTFFIETKTKTKKMKGTSRLCGWSNRNHSDQNREPMCRTLGLSHGAPLSCRLEGSGGPRARGSALGAPARRAQGGRSRSGAILQPAGCANACERCVPVPVPLRRVPVSLSLPHSFRFRSCELHSVVEWAPQVTSLSPSAEATLGSRRMRA